MVHRQAHGDDMIKDVIVASTFTLARCLHHPTRCFDSVASSYIVTSLCRKRAYFA